MDRKQLQNGRVIIPYGRSVMALVAAHSLGQKGIEVIGCDTMDLTILSFSRHVSNYFLYPDPLKDEQDFIDRMIEKVKAFHPGDDRPYVLMPIYKETDILAKHKDALSPYIQVATPCFEAMEKLHAKDKLARTLKDLNVRAPKTFLPETEDEIGELDLKFPVIIKPYQQTGGRGIHKVENKNDLRSFWQQNQEKYNQKSLIQEAVDGEDYCLTALYDHGTLKASMAYRNLHTFPPNDSGAGSLRETIEDARFTEIANDLMSPLKWNGVAEIDFLWNEKEDSAPYLIEVNSRFWGGLFQSVESGIDFPWLLYQLTVTGTVEEAGDAKIGTKTKMPYIWLLSAVKGMMEQDDIQKEIDKKGKAAIAQMKEGDIWRGLTNYSKFIAAQFGEHLNFSKKADKLQQTIALSREARSEFMNSEDPNTAFGALFILSSLLRHGELPDEIRF